MRSVRLHAAGGLLAAALVMAVQPSTGRAATTRPHPLFGNAVLGNSAEIVTMWPTGAAGTDSCRITDFMPLPNPGWLSPRPPHPCPGGPADASFQQLDVATGDLDGDGRDDLVAAYTLATSDPWMQRVVLEVPDVRSGPLDFGSMVTDTQGTVAVERGAYRSPSNVRLAMGNFDSDDAQEFVLGTRVQRNFHGTLHGDDQFGTSLAALGDVDGDGIGDVAVGAPGDDDGGPNRGSVWILFLRSDGTVRSQQMISDNQGGFTGILDNSDGFGSGVAALGDHDGDGIRDLAVGAYGDDDGGADRGAMWLLHLNRDGTVKSHLKISDTVGNFTGILDNSDHFGDRMASLGDFDGDGFGDLAVSATADDDGGTDRGAVWLLYLNSAGVRTWQKISNLPGLDNGDRLGFGLAYYSHFNGAGARVLAAGAPLDDDGGADRGAVWLLFLNPDGTVASQARISSLAGNFGTGLDNGDYFGFSIAALPDLDGDGVGELAIGALDDDDGGTDRGAVWLVYPNASGTVKTRQKISNNQGGFAGALANDDRFGSAVVCPGDLDGDGKADLVVGALGDDTGGTNIGCAWFVHLGSGLNVVKSHLENGDGWDSMLQLQLMELDQDRRPVTLAWRLGQTQDDGLKESTRFDIAAGDFDSDGVDELVVGGVRRRADNGNMELFVTIYAYQGGALVERGATSYGNMGQGSNGYGLGVYHEHVAIATGHLRTALTDQILFSWSTRDAAWDEVWMGCSIIDNRWDFYHTTRAHLATLDVNAVTWAISGWDVDQKEHSIVGDLPVQTCGDPYDPAWTGPSLGLAVGDLTGDGMDEVAWAAADGVYLYQLSGGVLAERTSVSRPRVYRDPGRRVVEIADVDATAGAPEWRPELVVQDWGAATTKQRIRVFQAATDGSGIITGLTPRGELLEAQVPMAFGDVALACGDFDGDGLRLGSPSGPRTITDAVHPSVILGAPPVHFDVFEQPYDLAGCYPGNSVYACDPDFQATYERETTQQYAVQTEIKSDWGLSAQLKGSAEGFGAKVEGRMKATYGEHFARTGSQSHTYTVSEFTITDGVDRILADAMTYTLWEYPVRSAAGSVVGHIAVMEPGSTSPTTQWFTYDSWAALTGAQPPVITHEPGNVLSYSKLVPESGAYGQQWKAYLSGWEVGLPGIATASLQACEAPHCFDLRWQDVSGGSVETSWNAGFEIGATVSYEQSDPLGEMKAGISVEVEGTYETSEMATHSVSIGQDIHLGATLGHLGGVAEAPYTVYPYVYRSSTSGTLVLDYKVMPAGVLAENWWGRYLNQPDLTFMLPRLHREEKGFPLEDPTTRYRSPDVRLMPDQVVVGDTVTIRAMVRNYSLMDWGPATVRFSVQDPEGVHVTISDVNGQSAFTTTGAIPAREGRPVTIRWIVPPGISSLARVYAQVDPGGLVAEVHETNNKAYALLHVTDGVAGPVEVPPPTAGVSFRLEQSAPNPFHGSTTIAFGLPERTRVELKVYDVAGRLIATLVNAELAPGRHEFHWDGRSRDGSPARPGIYLYRIDAGAFGATRRMVRLD